MAFNLTEFLACAEFPSREARQNVEAWLQEIECTTRGTLRGLDVDKHAPAEILIGWRAALRDAIARLQAEAGILCTVSFLFCFFIQHHISTPSQQFIGIIPIPSNRYIHFAFRSSTIRTAPAAGMWDLHSPLLDSPNIPMRLLSLHTLLTGPRHRTYLQVNEHQRAICYLLTFL